MLSNLAKSEYLRANFPVNSKSQAGRNPLYGVGINDADYLTQPTIGGKIVACPAYRTWKNMLRRAYCKKYQEKQPAYAGVKVCYEWHSFMTFRVWWLVNQVDGWELDKDLLTNFREYSPESCIFVPSWVNTFTADRRSARGDLPIGVCWHKSLGRHLAYCRHPFGKQEHLGLFSDAGYAHAAWRARKLQIAAELKRLMDEIDERIYPRVVEIINLAK